VSPTALRLFATPALVGAPADASAIGTKALALLAFLALEPGPHSRERLAALLWGEHTDDAARASLRQALMQIRQATGDALLVTRTSVEARGIATDAADFIALAATDPAAAARYDVPRFLDGFVVRHAPAFEEWANATKDRLLAAWTAVQEALAREAMARWEWRQAAGHAAAWLEFDPLSEEAVRLLVEGLYLAGDRSAALSRYAAYRARLLSEVGTEPPRALLQLVRRIEADAGRKQTPRPVTAERSTRLPSLDGPLVGRGGEMDALARVWGSVRRGSGRVVLVEGEAGVGKTRLVEELLRRVVAEGGLALRGRGQEAQATLPYGLIVDLLTSGLDAPGFAGTDAEWLAELTRLAPELRRRFPSLPQPVAGGSSAEVWRLGEAVSQLLFALAAEQPVVVVLDDLHWSDAESCHLLDTAIRRLEQAPVLWCATLTLGELARDTPAARLARALRARPRATPLTLAPLGEDDVWQMVRELGHIHLPTGGRRFAARLHEVTGGNPFYVVELLRTLFAQGWLATDAHSGEWLAAAPSEQPQDIVMGPTVHDAIAGRIESLSPDLHDVLITIALAGTGCRPDLLSHVHGISRLRAATLADGLVERYLVAERDAVYRPAHPVIARVIRHGLTTSRRREVHRSIALVLELLGSSNPGGVVPHGEIGRHAELGGEQALAYRHALAAADAAVERYAHEEALSWLDLAATCAEPGAESDAVNQRAAHLLSLAGWSEAPATCRRHAPAPGELEPGDLDLRVTSDSDK
jgi:DNA-binding SARP family transcriptional activator